MDEGVQRRVEALFERIAVGHPLYGWSVVGAPRESLRATPRARDVLLIRLPERTSVRRIVRATGDWLLTETTDGTRWTRVLEDGRVREHLAIARRIPFPTEQQSTPPPAMPVLAKDTKVALPSEADLPALRTALRLENVAPSTRTFLDAIVRLAKASPGATLMQDLKQARDDLATGPASITATVVRAIDKVRNSAATYDDIVALGALTDTSQLQAADAMTKLAAARAAVQELLDRTATVQSAITGAKAAAKKLAKASSPLAPRADAARTVAAQLLAWLTAIKKSKEWSRSLTKFVDQKRAGGSLDSTHMQRAKVGSRELTAGALPRFSEWDLLGAGDLLDDSLARKAGKAKQKLTLTGDIKATFSKAFKSAQSAAPTSKMLDDCADAIIAAVPALAADGPQLRNVARDLIIRVAGDRMSTTTALDRVTTALTTSATKVFAEDLLEAAKLWPFEPSHFLDRTMRVFDGFAPGFDIFDLIGKHLVTYNFFGQDPIVISEDLVAPLMLAERHYFGMRTQFPTTSFIVARETGAFNFRLARAKVMRKLILKAPKGYYVHTIGRAIDVNYPDDRNPHVTQPKEIWLPVNATLAFAATQTQDPAERATLEGLAAINFGEASKHEDILYDILAASRQFMLSFAAFEAAAPQTFLAPQTGWPTATQYAAALAAIDRGKTSKAVKAAVKKRDEAVAAEKTARAKLLDISKRMLKAWRADLKTLGARLQKYLDDASSASQLAHVRAIMTIDKQRGPLEPPLKDLEAATKPDASVRTLAMGEHARRVSFAAGIVRRDIVKQADARDIKLATVDLKVARARSRWRSEQEYYEGLLALLPRDATPITSAQTAFETAVAATDAAKADPVLGEYLKGQRELALIAAHNTYRRFYTQWAQQGFTDHDPVYLWAMKRGGFTWGGEFSEPDLHHFEIKAGLDWSANW